MQPSLSAQAHQEQSVPFLFVFVLNGSNALSSSLNLRFAHVCFSPFHLFLSGSILVCVCPLWTARLRAGFDVTL
jgi:hypothetical protein